jgi:hypothetical protein
MALLGIISILVLISSVVLCLLIIKQKKKQKEERDPFERIKISIGREKRKSERRARQSIQIL